MANTNIDLLYPEFWAASFDELDIGKYQLQNYVSRKYEGMVGRMGDTVNVPLTPDMGDADDWTPGSSISATDVAQETVQVILDKSKKKTFTLNGTELSLSAYELIERYGVSSAKSIVKAVNSELYKEFLKGKYFAKPTVDEDAIVDMMTKLSNREIGDDGRVLFLAPDECGTLLKKDAFQYANSSGDQGKAMREGLLQRKFRFDIFENNIIADYTPADLVGAVNNGAGYAEGATTMVVDGFDDDANPIRPGDVFQVAGETGTPWHTVISTTTTTSDTTGITFYPGLAGAVVDDAAVTFEATRSGIAFVPNAMALAARPYEILPEGVGVKSMVIDYMGCPIRISVWHDGKLGVLVQYDILFGVKKVKDERIERLVV